jgi:hypothetical protein
VSRIKSSYFSTNIIYRKKRFYKQRVQPACAYKNIIQHFISGIANFWHARDKTATTIGIAAYAMLVMSSSLKRNLSAFLLSALPSLVHFL